MTKVGQARLETSVPFVATAYSMFLKVNRIDFSLNTVYLMSPAPFHSVRMVRQEPHRQAFPGRSLGTRSLIFP